MKVLPFLVGGLLSPARAFAPLARSNPRRVKPLQAEKNIFSQWKTATAPVLTTLIGWSLAGQIASATLPIMDQQQIVLLPSNTIAEKISEMDFSLPSYSDSVKGADITKGKTGMPSFNPFGDFEPGKVAEEFSSSIIKPQQQAAPVADVDEPKPAAVDRKAAAAAEKAAAQAKKAQEQAAADAKKAEKEARVKAEREKQKAAMERSKQQEETASAAKMDAPSFKAPEVPEFKAPDFKLPDTSAFKMPDTSGFKMPERNTFKAPEMPKFDMPDKSSFKAPDMPKFDMPDTGNFKAPAMPKFDMPDTSSFKAPDMPKFDMPKFDIPKNDYIDMNQMPKFDAPKISLPSNLPSLPSFGGGGSSKNDVVLDSQDARDGRARDARQVYLQFDASAKEIEAQAREARNLANEKKSAANAAKDEACQTRPGGKWICLRNPFSVGF